MIKAILFDMDGVLIDAREWHYEALNNALNHFGYHIGKESHLEIYDGLPTSVKLDMLTNSQRLPKDLHELIHSLKQEYTLKIAYERCKPTFNHLKCLSQLHDEGYKIAVCSNSIRKTIDAFLSLAKLDQFIDLIISNEDVESPKPSPEMYNKAVNEFGFSKLECLIIEDNENGIIAAEASGCNYIKVNNPDEVTYDKIISSIN